MALIRTWLVKLALLAALFLASPISAGAQVVLDVADTEVSSSGADDPDLYVDPAISPVDDEALRTAFRRLKRNDDIQFELRTDLPEPPPPTPGWLKALGKAIATFFEIIAPLLIGLFWMGVGALAMVVLYAIALGLIGLRDRLAATDEDGDAAPVAEYRPSSRTMRILLSEADRLAAEGRYAEAVHLLLYRSIQDIESARPDAVRLSLTSREIARSDALGPQTRANFAELARIVERSHFGGRPVDAPDYAQARAVYERFAAPVAAAAPALPPAGAVA